MKVIFSHKKLSILALVGILLIGGIAFVALGYYPVLLVNGTPVSARRFFQNVRSASVYEARLIETYPQSVSSTPRREIEAEVLNNLVEEALLNDEFHREVGREADTLVEEKLQNLSEHADLFQNTKMLYGLSMEEFRQAVLVPQAEKDILRGRLFLKGESIDEWMEAARHAAHVTVLSAKFYWDGKRIVPKE